MAAYKDRVVYPSTPDRYLGSKKNGSTKDLTFAIQVKQPDEGDTMPSIEDAYEERHKEHR